MRKILTGTAIVMSLASMAGAVPPDFQKSFSPNVIKPGETSTLTLTIDNSANAAPATFLGFTDTFPTGMTLASPDNKSNSCGGIVSAVSSAVALINGSVSAGNTCSVSVDVTASTSGDYENTSGDLTSSQGTSSGPTDTLTVLASPGVSKVFSPDVISPGATTRLTFTIDNSVNSVAVTNLLLIDNLPAGVEVVLLDANFSNTCGGNMAATIGTIQLSGAATSVAGGGSCTAGVNVTSSTLGDHLNTTNALTSSAGTGSTASDTLTVVAPPDFSKSFSSDIIKVGDTSTLTLTLDSSANTITVSAIAFTDVLPSGVTVATIANEVNGCNGSLTASGGSISLSGGSVSAGSICTIDVDVTASSAGDKVNTTGTLSTDAGTGSTANDTLVVLANPGFSKDFAPQVIVPDAISVLTFTIDNSANSVSVGSLALTDTLPSGMTVTSPANFSNGCSGTVTAVAGAGSISLSGGSVAASSSCTIDVDVTSSTEGDHTNTTGTLSSDAGTGGTASDTLIVDPLPGFSKAFNPDTIFSGGTSTTAVTDVAFEDNLPIVGGEITQIIDANGDGGGNTLDGPEIVALDGIGNLYLTGAFSDNAFKITSGGTIIEIIDSGGDGTGNTLDRTYAVAVDGADNVYVTGVSSDNLFKITPGGTITEIIDATGDGTGNNILDFPASVAVDGSGNIYVAGLTSDNAFKITPAGLVTEVLDSVGDGSGNFLDGPQFVAVGSNGLYATGLISDNVFRISPSIEVATPSNADNGCGGSLSADPGSGAISYSNGSTGAGANCTVSVDVTSSVAGSHVNTSGNLSSSAGTSSTATDTLTVEALPGFSKVFSPAVIFPGETSTLTFTVDNTAAGSAITTVAFSDTLPTGVVIASPNGANDGCGGTLAAAAGGGTVTYSSGSTGAGAS